MSVCSNRVNCKPAQLCYYDLLDAETAESVPEDVHKHIALCPDCRSDIDRLRGLLASAAKRVDSEQSRKDSAITELLSLHFAWVDRLVACGDAKPFLPSLADPITRIRIPTPITAHVDNCQACAKDLSALRDAALTHKQLCRLSRILAEDVAEDAESREVRAAFPAVAEIMERPDSGITTRFTFGESAEPGAGEPQIDRPIEVEVITRRQSAGALPNRHSSGQWQRALILNLKRYIGPAASAAAVLLVGLALFLATPTVGAVDVDYVLKALNGASNIHATYFEAGRKEPERERWVSKPLKKYMLKVGQERTLWDLREDSKTVKSSQDAPPEAASFTPAELARAKSMLDNTQGLAPCKSKADVPPNAKWGPAPDVPPPLGTQNLEVYDLTWTDGGVMRRWRVFMDPAKNRPERVEYHSKLPAEAEYTPQYEYTLEYLSDADMRAAIERFFP